MVGRRKEKAQGQWDGVVRRAKAFIPSVESILDEVLERLQLSRCFVQNKFSESLRRIDEKATEIYLSYERSALNFAAECWLEANRDHLRDEWGKLLSVLQEKGWDAFKSQVMPLFVDFAELVQRLEKDLGNMRKARGGATFEQAVMRLLKMLDIPCEKPVSKNVSAKLKRIDLVVPDIQTALEKPERSVFLTLKRTLREQWKQEVPTAQGRRCWLLTIDTQIGIDKVDEIKDYGLELYALDEVAVNLQKKSKTWVHSLNDLPNDLRKALEEAETR